LPSVQRSVPGVQLAAPGTGLGLRICFRLGAGGRSGGCHPLTTVDVRGEANKRDREKRQPRSPSALVAADNGGGGLLAAGQGTGQEHAADDVPRPFFPGGVLVRPSDASPDTAGGPEGNHGDGSGRDAQGPGQPTARRAASRHVCQVGDPSTGRGEPRVPG